MIILGLDIGKEKTGVAISSGIIAEELTTLSTKKDLIKEVGQICRERSGKKIIIGLPMTASGEDSEEAKYIKDLAQKIHTALGLEVAYEDETLTSQEALDILLAEGVKPEEAEARLHQASAKLILDQFLSK